ncbi:hypothetical protein K435DRAFT_869909 [Dendrothele bispora CBS 962.96]|uniref:Uncharacterized protein n=1 Tax=Dendrothele bispora (strain CBS 962.96) TaxID=1314807 RepID=A0A4S8L9B5_DENBC|nr:hypothetical protein K435DRAFT_869909 [Dendrothele bispora CBS 962.96]
MYKLIREMLVNNLLPDKLAFLSLDVLRELSGSERDFIRMVEKFVFLEMKKTANTKKGWTHMLVLISILRGLLRRRLNPNQDRKWVLQRVTARFAVGYKNQFAIKLNKKAQSEDLKLIVWRALIDMFMVYEKDVMLDNSSPEELVKRFRHL